MGFTCQYPIDFRVKVLSEYKQGKVGYKTLANKYGLKRDTVRYWVLQKKIRQFHAYVVRVRRKKPRSASRKKPIFDKRKEPKLPELDLLFRVIQAVPIQELL